MCPFYILKNFPVESIVCFGVKVFLILWVIFVPVVMTNRLEQIIKLLKDKK